MFANSTTMVVIVVLSSSKLMVELIAHRVIDNGERIDLTV